FLRGSGRADRSGQKRLALAPLLGHSGLLRASSLRAGSLGLALPARGFPFLGALEHAIPARRRHDGAYPGNRSDKGQAGITTQLRSLRRLDSRPSQPEWHQPKHAAGPASVRGHYLGDRWGIQSAPRPVSGSCHLGVLRSEVLAEGEEMTGGPVARIE